MPCDNEKGNLVTTGEMLSWLKKKKKKNPRMCWWVEEARN